MAEKDQGDRWDLKVELHTLGQQKPLTEKCAELQKTMGMVSLLVNPGEKGGKGDKGEPGIGERGEKGPPGPIGNNQFSIHLIFSTAYCLTIVVWILTTTLRKKKNKLIANISPPIG